MPPFAEIHSESDDEAPESFSLVQSKKEIKKSDNALKKFEAGQKEKKRAQNRERDRRLKERAEVTKGKGKQADDEMDVEARMERAMREAQEEMDEDNDESDKSRIDDDSEGSGSNDEGGDGGSAEEMDSGDEDMGSDADDNEDTAGPSKTPSNPNHLPDHLFTSAFASHSARTSSTKRPSHETEVKKKPRKRKTVKGPKDLIIGSRAIRTLSNSSRPASAAGTMPSQRIKKFLDRTLSLKGGKRNAKGWERKPANIGVLKRNGPPTNFVRSR